jgi:hypothetical protein
LKSVTKVVNARAQASECIDTRETHKRKIACVGVDCDAHKENESPGHHGSLSTPAAIKRICREKTGTDWQTVLDIVNYSEERRSRQNKASAIEGK